MKKILLTLGSLACLASLVVAGPGWSRVNYTQSTIFTGVVTIYGQPAAEGDVVGIFVNNECRMVSTVFTKDGKSYVSAVLHGNTSENAVVKVWQKETNKIFDVDTIVTTKPDDEIQLFPITVKSAVETTPIAVVSELPTFNVVTNGNNVVVQSDKLIKSIVVIDNIGKRLSTEHGGIGNVLVQLDDMPHGVYFLAITFDDNSVITKKVVKYKD